jgi:(+)-trans-carveol dehydrogenase
VNRLEGKVAFVTGASRGQGRSQAVRLAEEGADVIAVDIASQSDTVAEVEALGRSIVATEVDIRNYAALKAALDDGVARLGRLDIVVANAGIVRFGPTEDVTEQDWQDVIDINLTGAWHTAKAAIPHLRAQRTGSIVINCSGASFKGLPHVAAYTASKHGALGLMRTLANELGADMIRVNTVHPGVVDNDMVHNEAMYRRLLPDHDGPITREQVAPIFQMMNALAIPWVESVDIANAVLFLASDEARYITGSSLSVDAGQLVK